MINHIYTDKAYNNIAIDLSESFSRQCVLYNYNGDIGGGVIPIYF